MTRKATIVDRLFHQRSGTSIAIRLDKNTMTFQAELDDLFFTDRDGQVLKRKLFDYIDQKYKLQLFPIIEIEQIENHFAQHGDVWMGLRAYRYYVGTINGRWYESQWSFTEDHMESAIEHARYWSIGNHAPGFSVPYRSGKTTVIHYTSEAWERIQAIQAKLKKLADDLNIFLNSDDFVKKISSGGNVLPEGDKE